MATTNIITETEIKELSTDHVIIYTTRFLIEGDNRTKLEDVSGVGYDNSAIGRQSLQDEQAENVIKAVMAIWGTFPTVIEEVNE